jgi:type IV pilus assembly protein PilW
MNRKAARRLTVMVAYSRGLALIELMIALVLGVVIIGAVTGIMLSNIQGFRTTRGLSQIQDSARVGYELLARDIRQAANVPCGNDIPVVNILNDAQGPAADVPWQYDFNNAFIGFGGDDGLDNVSNQIDGTESFVMLSGDVNDAYMLNYTDTNNGANFDIATASGAAHGYTSGNILMACNEKQATIFQVTNINNGGNLVASTGNKTTPGNCTKGFGAIEPGNGNQLCNTNGNPGPYGPNTVLANLSSTAWYIGDNGRAAEGGRSLYMARLDTGGTGAAITEIEIAAGVTAMNLRYRLIDTADFIDAATVGNRWANVNAVEVSLELLSQDQGISTDSGVDQGRLGRGFTSVVAIRNRSL